MSSSAPCFEPDPVIEAYKAHVDRARIRANLTRTHDERLRALLAEDEVMAERRRAAAQELEARRRALGLPPLPTLAELRVACDPEPGFSGATPSHRLAGFEPDPVIEAYKQDVDRTLFLESLKLTHHQRVLKLIALELFAQELRRAGDELRARERQERGRLPRPA